MTARSERAMTTPRGRLGAFHKLGEVVWGLSLAEGFCSGLELVVFDCVSGSDAEETQRTKMLRTLLQTEEDVRDK